MRMIAIIFFKRWRVEVEAYWDTNELALRDRHDGVFSANSERHVAGNDVLIIDC